MLYFNFVMSIYPRFFPFKSWFWSKVVAHDDYYSPRDSNFARVKLMWLTEVPFASFLLKQFAKVILPHVYSCLPITMVSSLDYFLKNSEKNDPPETNTLYTSISSRWNHKKYHINYKIPNKRKKKSWVCSY